MKIQLMTKTEHVIFEQETPDFLSHPDVVTHAGKIYVYVATVDKSTMIDKCPVMVYKEAWVYPTGP